MDEETGFVYFRESSESEPVRRGWHSILAEKIPWVVLEGQEIARCQLRDKNGFFTGQPPQRLPAGARAARKRALMERAGLAFELKVERAAEYLGEVLDDENADVKDRIAAADRILDRGIGPKPQKLEVTAEVKPWEGLVTGILVDVNGEDELNSVEG
jgi:hypothetical protein